MGPRARATWYALRQIAGFATSFIPRDTHAKRPRSEPTLAATISSASSGKLESSAAPERRRSGVRGLGEQRKLWQQGQSGAATCAAAAPFAGVDGAASWKGTASGHVDGPDADPAIFRSNVRSTFASRFQLLPKGDHASVSRLHNVLKRRCSFSHGGAVGAPLIRSS